MWVLAVFTAVHCLLTIDKSIMVVVLEPIRQEFSLSDTQLGLLTGFGFTIFFGLAGLPLGYLVDRWNRRNILAASVATFSLMTTLTAGVASFSQVLAMRLLVGAGEAGGTPSMLSMLSDLFPPSRRAKAVSVYYAGVPIGGMVVLLGGGWFAQHYGWRALFLVAGIPGLLLALCLLLFVQEPIRKQDQNRNAAPPFSTTLKFMWSQSSVRHLVAMTIVGSAASQGLFYFAVAYLIRVQQYSLQDAGFTMGMSYGVVGLVATFFSGALVDKIARRDERWRGWYCALSSILSFLAILLMVLSPRGWGTVAGLAIWGFSTIATYGPTLALLQSLVGDRMRGTVAAIYLFLAYFVGASIGPQFLGLVSDWLTPAYGPDALAFAMVATSALYCWAAVHYLLASRTVTDDLQRAMLH